jgi:hypothetical protein
MAELKFAVLFEAVDQLSGKLGTIGSALGRFTTMVKAAGAPMRNLGDAMANFGLRMGVVSAVMSEGASKMREWSDSMAEPAMGMERQLATMSAMTGLAGDQLDAIKRRALDFASVHPGVTADEWVGGFTRMRGIFQDTAQAMKAEDVSAMLTRLGLDSSVATRLIQVGWANLRTDAATTGDSVTRAIQAFGLAPEQANNFAMAVGRMGASAAAANAPFSEVLALAGEAQRLLGGGRVSMIFASMMQGLENAAAQGKVAIDFSHGLIAALQQLKSQLTGTPIERLAQLKDMGVTGGPQLLKLLDNLGEVTTKNQQIANSAGALGKAYGTATANAADEVKLLHQNVSNLYDALYSPALPTINRWLGDLVGVTREASGAAEHHSGIARIAALSLTALGTGGYYALQAMSTLGTSMFFAGTALKMIAPLFGAVGGIFSSIGSLGAVAGMASVPLLAAIAAAAALGFAAYEIWKHWNSVKLALVKTWEGIKEIFTSALDWMRDMGANLVRALADAIKAAIDYQIEAAKSLAAKIGGFFHFHSPPAYGPLREAMLNFRFSDTLADQLKATPKLMAAATGLAAVIAASALPPVRLAAAMATTATPGTIALPPPTSVSTPPFVRERREAAGASTQITIHYSPVINSTSPDEWVKAARQHADELVRIIDSKLYRRDRLKFQY